MSFRFFHEERNDPRGRKSVLLVEGKDDAVFFDTLLGHMGFSGEDCRIIFTRGTGALPGTLLNVLKSRDFVQGETRSVAVIRDADSAPEDSLNHVQEAFRGAGVETAPDHAEVISVEFEKFERKFGTFLIPSSTRSGMLETLLLDTREGDSTLAQLRAVFLNIEVERGEPFDIPDKRLMGMLLAVSDYGTAAAGMATRNGAFPLDHPQLTDLRDYLSAFLD